MNVNYLIENDHEEIKDILTDNGFKQVLNATTRVTDQTSPFIDLIFVNNYQNIRYKRVIPTGLNDHDLIACVRKVNNVKYESETIRYRDYKDYDVNVINNELLNINWDGVYNSNSPNQSLNVIKSILKDTIDRHAPFVTKRIKGNKSPWMSKEIKRHMNIRDQLYRKPRNQKNNQIGFHTNAKRNFIKKEIQRTKKNVISKELRDTSNKPDKFWNTFKKLYSKKSKFSKFTTTFRTIDSKMLTEKQSIADGFCQFFSSAANSVIFYSNKDAEVIQTVLNNEFSQIK